MSFPHTWGSFIQQVHIDHLLYTRDSHGTRGMIQSRSAVLQIGTTAMGPNDTTAAVKSHIHYLHWEWGPRHTGPLSITSGNSSNPCLSKHTYTLVTQKEPNLSFYPSSSQRSSRESQTGYEPLSRKWIIIGFTPILPYLWAHICDCSKYGTMTQFCPNKS